MMAMSKKIPDQDPGAIEALLPWHVAGTLSARDARRVDEALASDPELAKQYAAVREEYAETILLNESLGAPSSRAMQKLFAAIDAEPARRPHASFNPSARIARFFAGLSSRTVATAAAVAALVLLLQAGVIGAVLMKQKTGTFQTASLTDNERGIAVERGPVALVRFVPDARVADITAFLDTYHASIVDGARNGMFRLQFSGTMSPRDVAGLMTRLQNEKIISLAVAAQ
jgi:anti-sigma factor RsiW